MLVHSFIYYKQDAGLITDQQWQTWADELVRLQSEHGTKIGFYDEAFADWDGSTGYHLPQDNWVAAKAAQLLAYASLPPDEKFADLA